MRKETAPFDFDLFEAGLMDMPDGMTNGDVIRMMFHNEFVREEYTNVFWGLNTSKKDWWNAPYKREVKG